MRMPYLRPCAGTLTGLQWGIYDSFKVFVGLPTTGSVEVKTEEKKEEKKE